jgi:hypothetical protein
MLNEEDREILARERMARSKTARVGLSTLRGTCDGRVPYKSVNDAITGLPSAEAIYTCRVCKLIHRGPRIPITGYKVKRYKLAVRKNKAGRLP